MRTKLFITFLMVITLALVSNLIYQRLISEDFRDYSMGVEQDRLYIALASVEGSYSDQGRWDTEELESVMRWGTLLGYELVVTDIANTPVASSALALEGATETLRRRIESMVHIDQPAGHYEQYPLFSGGEEIGYLHARPLKARSELRMKEDMFRLRGREFLLISFLIAGGSAVVLAVFMSLYLARPLRRLKRAAERISEGDLSVRVAPGPRDEVGRLIESFNSMVASLEQEETLRRHLTSNIAHELRTPLSVLRSSLEAVSDGIVPCEQASIMALEGEVTRLTSIVKGIEDFTRAEAALISPPENEHLELGDFLNSIASAMQSVFSDKGLTLRVESPGHKVDTYNDPSRIESIVRNLLANAAAHTKEGGATLSYGTVEGGVFIEISDTGTGIAKQDIQNIFKRFYKGPSSEGTGLGLSIARELAHSLGGTLTAMNLPEGSGASLRLELPTTKGSPAK